MERFTPLYAIAGAIMNNMENLRFDKKDNFHVLVRARVPTSISRSPKLPLVFLLLYGNTENVFYFLNYKHGFA